MYIEQIIQFTAFVWQQDHHPYSNTVVSFFVTLCILCEVSQLFTSPKVQTFCSGISTVCNFIFLFLFIPVEVFTKGSNSFFIYKHLIPFCCQPYWFQYTCTCTVNPLETVHYRYNRHTAHSVLF